MNSTTAALPDAVTRFLDEFIRIGREALGDDLRAVVLFGSGAEGRLRATSDVNLIAVLARFDRGRMDRVREIVQAAGAAIQLRVMFLLETEVEAAARAFGVKFSDILHRHRVLYGSDPFARLRIDRAATITRLEQVLLNLVLRLRERYVSRSLQPERLTAAIADAIGPLRVAAATLLELEGHPAASPREAFAICAGVALTEHGPRLMERLSDLRERGTRAAGDGPDLVFRLIALAEAMRVRAGALGAAGR